MIILQTNLNRSRAAHDLLEQTVKEENVDVVLVAEPNKKLAEGATWIADKNKDAAIKIYKQTEETIIKRVVRKDGIIWLEMKDLRICCGYISPNDKIDRFKEFVQDIEELLENNGKKKCIVAGDFNSKSKNWGSPRTDKRGEIVEEMIAAKQMVIANVGEEPTFVRGSQVSHLDITLHSEELAGKLKDWKVMDKETMSDHKYIIYKADTSKKNETRTTGKKKWVINDRNMKDLGANIQMTYWKYGKAIDTAEQLETIITEASDKTFTRGGGKGRRFQANYWWNEEIAQKRKACQALQRKIIRENKKYYKTRQGETLNKIQELKQEQNDNRKELRKAILASKKKKWKEITQELENDIWGKAYQIVTGKMKLRSKGELDTEEQIKIAKDLFPETAAIRWEAKEIETEEIPSLNAKELEAAAETMKRRKAPGPDQIPNEVVKAVVKEIPEEVLSIMNGCLKKNEFPTAWKIARLVLIPKLMSDRTQKQKYRPLCMLSALGKLLERMIEKRLREEVEERGGMAETQFGFRKGRSTIDALKKVVEIANRAKNYSYRHKKLCVMIVFDVKNAFNTARWPKIVAALEELKISPYLINIVQSYLDNRRLEIGSEKKRLDMKMGVPQGSVLGPLLWNVFYDGVLKVEVPPGIDMIAYADDLALIATSKERNTLEQIIKQSVNRIEEWMLANGLELAPGKTEAVILSGRRKLKTIKVKVGNTEITTKKSIRYLGVMIDKDLKMTEHIKKTTERVDKTIATLTRIMPSEGGPSSEKRKILASVAESIILYGSVIWEPALKIKKYSDLLTKCQRKVVLRVISAYKTVSTAALLVIAGTPPIDLLARERNEIHKKGVKKKKEEREKTYEKWQERWDGSKEGAWTRKLIPSIKEWIENGATGVDHYTSQFLTGHGSFGSYLQRIKKIDKAECAYCAEEEDTPEHLLTCPRWREEMGNLKNVLGEELTADNFRRQVVKGKWMEISNALKQIMRIKTTEEQK
jgi:exonuclease III